jgi:anti-sigma-K factor RskA
MNEHDIVDPQHVDLVAYLLGGLDATAHAQVERHLTACAQCRQLLHEYEAVLRLVPLGLPRAQPSPQARAALRRRLQQAQPGVTTPQVRRGQWWRGLRLPRLAATLATVLVLALGALGLVIQMRATPPQALVAQLQRHPDVQVVRLAGSAAAPQAVGDVLLAPNETRAALVVDGLPPLASGRSYQVWLIDSAQRRQSAGVFRVDAQGAATVTLTVPSERMALQRIGVTEEPAGGSPAPTGRNVLMGSL